MEKALPQIDLRFEQSFVRSLYAHAGAKYPEPGPAEIEALTDDELRLLGKQVSREEKDVQESVREQRPQSCASALAPIPPSVVMYTVIKDQVIMPLLQGFVWTGFLLAIRPTLTLVTRHGQATGSWLIALLGLNKVIPNPRVTL